MLKFCFVAAFVFFGVSACDSGDGDVPVEGDLGVSAGDGGDGDAQPAPVEGDLEVAATFEGAVATGQNTLTVTVTEADGTPVTGAVVTVDPQMPMHGHGSTETPVVTELGDGVYEATPVTFQMPGAWVVHVKATLETREGLLDLDVMVP